MPLESYILMKRLLSFSSLVPKSGAPLLVVLSLFMKIVVSMVALAVTVPLEKDVSVRDWFSTPEACV